MCGWRAALCRAAIEVERGVRGGGWRPLGREGPARPGARGGGEWLLHAR